MSRKDQSLLGFAVIGTVMLGCIQVGSRHRYDTREPSPSSRPSHTLVPAADGHQSSIPTALGEADGAKAVELARAFARQAMPGADLDQRPPSATFFPNATAHGGGSLWAIGFSIPAARNADGRIIGVRPFHTLTVWVKADGTAYGGITTTP